MSREINAEDITTAIADLAVSSNRTLPNDVAVALAAARNNENLPLAQATIDDLIKNQHIAAEQQLPLCQDTGLAVVFLEIGQEVQISGGDLTTAVNKGVAQGYIDGYLRKSIVSPLKRENTNDNTPAVIHTTIVPGDKLKITFVPKGGGAENMSRLAMLKPSAGIEGVKKFIIETVREAGPNPCPPVVVGVGIGGNFEYAPLLAKQALLRQIGSKANDPDIAVLEAELLTAINKLNIGAQGFGGKSTALAVHIATAPCHFATLPVAVNINCHVARHQSVIL